MNDSIHLRIAATALLFTIAVLATGCRQKVATKSTVTVTYTLDKSIAAAKQIDDEPNKWESAEPVALLAGNIVGDTTHPSYIEASVFSAADDASDKDIVVRFGSPGFSSSETLSVSKISFEGQKLIIQYDKVSPELRVSDFRQFTTLVHVKEAS